ncbi:MAG: PilZ domain-containing protein [Velocimicrobium sp.]
MEEKRKNKRLPAELFLDISSIFKQNNVKTDNVHAPIEVIDISKSGIGFKSTSILPIGFYFNAKLQLGGSDSVLNCVVRIVRSQLAQDETNLYGCEFVGLAPILDYIFDEYEESIKK